MPPRITRSVRSSRLGGVAACCLAAGISLGGAPAGVAAATTASPAVATSSAPTVTVHPAAAARTSMAPLVAASGAVDAAPMPNGRGFWTVTSSGLVSAFGAATDLGDLSGRALDAPVVGIASTPDGGGYWLVAADGGIFSYGDAAYVGSTGGLHLNQPIVGMTSTPSGHGYWLVAADGGIFSFGDARFHGSTGGLHLNQPIVGMASTPSGHGYWLVAADGGIFSYGDAAYHGSTGGLPLARPIVGMAANGAGGYWLVAADGGVFAFGDAPFDGSAAGSVGAGHAVGIVATPGGYWITTFGGGVLSYGAAAVLQSPQQASSSVVLGTADPAADTQPTTAYENACYSSTPSSACDTQALGLIDSARDSEGLGPLALPGNYSSLGPAQQLFAVTNAERTSRGLATFSALTTDLDNRAMAGAEATEDPTGPSGVSWASNLAWGLATPLAADFEWMYDDGPGSSNVDCTSSGSSGCWGHRHDILVPWGGSMGAAQATVQKRLSMTELFAQE